MTAMAVVIGVGIAAIFMVALGYVTSYASAEARVYAEHKTLLRSHERLQQAFDPRRFPLRYQGVPYGDLYGTPELQPQQPIVIFVQGSRPFRDPETQQIVWTWADTPDGLTLTNHQGFQQLPPGVKPIWSTPEQVTRAIVTTPKYWAVPAKRPYKVRRIG